MAVGEKVRLCRCGEQFEEAVASAGPGMLQEMKRQGSHPEPAGAVAGAKECGTRCAEGVMRPAIPIALRCGS